jgi:hypothetical protein
MDLLKEIKDKNVILLASDEYSDEGNDINAAIQILRYSKKLGYISVKKTYLDLAESLLKLKMDTREIIFVDSITATKEIPAYHDNVIIAEGVDSAQTECRAELNPPMPKASRVF